MVAPAAADQLIAIWVYETGVAARVAGAETGGGPVQVAGRGQMRQGVAHAQQQVKTVRRAFRQDFHPARQPADVQPGLVAGLAGLGEQVGGGIEPGDHGKPGGGGGQGKQAGAGGHIQHAAGVGVTLAQGGGEAGGGLLPGGLVRQDGVIGRQQLIKTFGFHGAATPASLATSRSAVATSRAPTAGAKKLFHASYPPAAWAASVTI